MVNWLEQKYHRWLVGLGFLLVIGYYVYWLRLAILIRLGIAVGLILLLAYDWQHRAALLSTQGRLDPFRELGFQTVGDLVIIVLSMSLPVTLTGFWSGVWFVCSLVVSSVIMGPFGVWTQRRSATKES